MARYAMELEGLCKEYEGFRLREVSFRVREGTIMGFIGRNGAGKTTTLKAALGQVRPSRGTVRFFGQDFRRAETEAKKEIGFVSGAAEFYAGKTIQAISQVTKSFYANWDDSAYRRYLALFGLDERKKIRELSQGMKVKYLLALALSHQARLLILDEPTSGLDPVSRDELLEIFTELRDREGASVLFSTHIISDLEKCADDIAYLQEGKLFASCALPEFIQTYGGGSESLEDIVVALEREHRRSRGLGREEEGMKP